MATKIRLAGVPEQINIPIHICLERGIFEKYGVDLEFITVREGTGRMVDMLEKDGTDLALTVTDAFMAAKAKGRHVTLIGTYATSPLVWAVAGAFGQNESIWTKKPLRFGISRNGSGSHAMAFYAAMKHNIDFKDLEFVVANDINGLKSGIQKGEFDLFLWETFTTNPYFVNSELSKVDDVPTPWPAFSFVAQNKANIEDKQSVIKNGVFAAIKEGMDIFLAESSSSSEGNEGKTIERIVKEFGHSTENAHLWLSRCRYADSKYMPVDKSVCEHSLSILKQVKLVPEEFQLESLWTIDFDGNSRENSVVTVI